MISREELVLSLRALSKSERETRSGTSLLAREAADRLEEDGASMEAIERWIDGFEKMMADTHTPLFAIGVWWADRPWRKR